VPVKHVMSDAVGPPDLIETVPSRAFHQNQASFGLGQRLQAELLHSLAIQSPQPVPSAIRSYRRGMVAET